MSDAPELRVVLPIRCMEPGDRPGQLEICGASASWQRASAGGRWTFACDVHRKDGDTRITFPATVPRLSVVIELVVTGASWNPAVAKAEAVERLNQAVAVVGAALNLHSVLFTTGRYAPPAPERAANASQGRGK